MTLEIPHQQNEKYNDREHAKAKVVPGGISTSPCGAGCHGSLDALFVTKCRCNIKLKETLLFSVFNKFEANDQGHEADP